MTLFRDRTVLITGASRGLGETFADALAAQGAKLILTARSAGDLDRVAASARAKGSPTVDVIAADVGAADGVKAVTEAVAGLGRTVDVLINNAGFGDAGRWAECDIERQAAMVRVNIEAVMRLTRHFLPGMLSRKAGGVINVASLGAFTPMPYMATYGATKAFVLSWSEALWAETRGTGVRVLALCPGPVPTGFNAAAGIDSHGHKRPNAITPEQCIAAALRAYEADRSFVVPGTLSRLLSLAPRILTRAKMAKLAAKNIGKRVLKEPGGSRE
jgi:short-subunit dehydrogenase